MAEKDKVVGFLPVFSALAGNLIVALLKFVAFLLSGSSVMFSEAVHSLADTLNQSFLAIGLKRSTKKPSDDFAYGFGRERFFWALISACGIFFLGAGVTIYRGVSALIHPEALPTGLVPYVVLLVSFVIESITFYLALHELRSDHHKQSFRHILKNGDPSTLAVLYEDGVALLGVIVAFVSILLTSLTGQYYYDAFGSIIIGLMLAGVALLLISKNREYLLGKAIPDELEEEIVSILEADPAIEKVIDFKSTTLDIGIYRIKCEIEFNGYVLLREIYQSRSTTLRDDYDEVKDDFEEFKKFCADYCDRLPRLVGKKIDEIELRLKTEYPGVKYIDIEIN
ncbi:MAG: cation diffusion facilitator family transporter [Patescibacteria group bacterium]